MNRLRSSPSGTARRAAPILVGLSLWTGCASTPAPEPVALDLQLPVTWAARPDSIAAGSNAEMQDWWRSLADTTLDSFVREALQANADLQSLTHNVQAAREQVTLAGADRWPQLSAGLSASRTKNIFVGLPVPSQGIPTSRSTSYRATLETSWELDLWNRLGHRQRAAVAQWEASRADLAAARLSLAGQVTKAWLDLAELGAQRDLAARSLEAYDQTQATAQRRYRRGLLGPVDVHLTRASRENAAALLALRENQLEAAARRLELLLGRYPAGRLRAGPLPDLPAPIPAGLPADLLLRRPDLLAAERRIVAADARVGESVRNLLPRIQLTGSTGTTSNQLSDLVDGDFSIWSIAGSLLQPIFQGGRLRAQVRAESAGRDAQRAAFVQRALVAFSEVENALATHEHLTRRETHLSAAAASARAAWSLAEDRYRQGIGDLLSVLEAQRRALDAQSQWLSVRNRLLQARVDLHLALGGGFDARHDPLARAFLAKEGS